MSEIEFENENNSFVSRTIIGAPTEPKIASFLIKNGFAKSGSSAERIIIGIIVSSFLLAILIPIIFINKNKDFSNDEFLPYNESLPNIQN